jgi:hypothetical protein
LIGRAGAHESGNCGHQQRREALAPRHSAAIVALPAKDSWQ